MIFKYQVHCQFKDTHKRIDFIHLRLKLSTARITREYCTFSGENNSASIGYEFHAGKEKNQNLKKMFNKST